MVSNATIILSVGVIWLILWVKKLKLKEMIKYVSFPKYTMQNQKVHYTLLEGTLPWLWFGLHEKNREGTVGFWTNDLDTYGLWEGSNKSFHPSGFALSVNPTVPTPTSSTCLFSPFFLFSLFTCTHLQGMGLGMAPGPSLPLIGLP